MLKKMAKKKSLGKCQNKAMITQEKTNLKTKKTKKPSKKIYPCGKTGIIDQGVNI